MGVGDYRLGVREWGIKKMRGGEMIRSYRDLEIWVQSKELVKKIYEITKKLPQEEIYVLVSQMRRAAVSVPSNIAEGHTRKHSKEFSQFLYQALASLAELDTQLEIVEDIYKIEIPDEVKRDIDLLCRKIRSVIKKIDEKINNEKNNKL
jgi:four helix bundle protein